MIADSEAYEYALGIYQGLEPSEVWGHFAALNAIPRPSGGEAAAREYVRRLAGEAGVPSAQDAAGNLVVRLAGCDASESASPVCIQAHLDMVCEQRPEVENDCASSPVRPRWQDGRIYAAGTTLGADNGIGAAMSLACLTGPDFPHPPLELLFTVDEETGLGGASRLDPDLIAARQIINLDTEEPGELIAGCAGGGTMTIHLPFELRPVDPSSRALEIRVSGLKGGHSGVQIHEPLANSLKLLAELLRQAGPDAGLSTLQGGNARNAIPRDALAVIVAPEESFAEIEDAVSSRAAQLRAAWAGKEQGLCIQTTPTRAAAAIHPHAMRQLVTLLCDLPHGPLTWSKQFPGKVETSANLAVARISTQRRPELEIVVSARSFLDLSIRDTLDAVSDLGLTAGGRTSRSEIYGGWAPRPGSPLLEHARAAMRQATGREPRVDVIHAGLECGALAARLSGLDAVSFGPRIRGAHTPEEYVEPETVEETWRVLTALLGRLASA